MAQHEKEALRSPRDETCPSAVSCKLPHASCAPVVGIPAPLKSPFSIGTTIAIAVSAFVLAGAATLVLGAAKQARSIVGWFEALRSKYRRGD